MKNVVLLAKRRQLKLLISVIRNQIRESFCRQKKTFIDSIDFKNCVNQKENIIDEHVVFKTQR